MAAARAAGAALTALPAARAAAAAQRARRLANDDRADPVPGIGARHRGLRPASAPGLAGPAARARGRGPRGRRRAPGRSRPASGGDAGDHAERAPAWSRAGGGRRARGRAGARRVAARLECPRGAQPARRDPPGGDPHGSPMTPDDGALAVRPAVLWAAAWALWLATGFALPVPPWRAQDVLRREEQAALALAVPAAADVWSIDIGGARQSRALGMGWSVNEAFLEDGRRRSFAWIEGPAAEVAFASPG